MRTSAGTPPENDDPIRREAELRSKRHRNHKSSRPLSVGYELVGLRGEQALADFFGGEVDLTPRPGGDNGRDIVVQRADGRQFLVDVKCLRHPENLYVEEGKVERGCIYVLASYSDSADRATLMGWEHAANVLRAKPRLSPKRIMSHTLHHASLRPLTELAAQNLAPVRGITLRRP